MLKVCGGLPCRQIVQGRLRLGRSRPTELACWLYLRRLSRPVSSSYADGKRLYVGIATDSLNYPHSVDPGLHGPHGLSEDLPSPRRDFARYVKCRGVQRGGPIIRVFTSAPRAASPGVEKLRHVAGHDITMPQRPPCRVVEIITREEAGKNRVFCELATRLTTL